MNEEENSFERTENSGQDARELHSFGGMKDESPEETEKTENEELEDAIEELESSEVEDSMPEEKIEEPKEEFKEDIPAKEPEEKPEFKLDEPVEEPKEEDPIMTIDSVKEPKEKKSGGAGWKVATFLFAVLAILGAGAACYLFFSDGTTKFLGREVSSKALAPKPSDPSKPSDTPVADTTVNTRYIYLDGHNLALKVPENIESLSYEYHRFNMADGLYNGNFSTLRINASTKNTRGAQAAPSFLGQNESGLMALGTIDIAVSEYPDQGSAPELVMKTNAGEYIYYYHPQQQYTQEGDDAKWESESIDAIEAWLTNKDNYVVLK
ncbi:hypothetical protein IK110_01040 [Candidatus Saccharibacteria bacterium]|nr:hypothetical protein [Candidatus Saccharibacteria bacterium]